MDAIEAGKRIPTERQGVERVFRLFKAVFWNGRALVKDSR